MQFRILGPLQVGEGPRLLPVNGSREKRILATLLLDANRMVPLDRLIDAVWGTDPPATAGTQVRNRVSGLRKSWAPILAQPDLVLATRGNGYLLNLEGHEFDLMDFDSKVAFARNEASTGDRPEAVRLLRSALGLWRGPALGGVGGTAITAAAAMLEERRLIITEECLGHEVGLGRQDDLIDEMLALAEAHPCRERLTYPLMLALYRSGRQAEALASYTRHVAMLRDELGLDPSPTIRKLQEDILRHSPVIGPQPTNAAADRILSVYSDSTIAQVTDIGVPRPAELPADVVDFTGRADEVDSLHDILSDRTRRSAGGMLIIAITGTAGVGKTALAIHWTHLIASKFPDGQLHLNLQGFAQRPPMRPTEALDTMLRALGARPDQIPVELDDMSRFFRTMMGGKRMLLLLDNARTAEQVRPLLPGSSNCLVVVTSRDRLSGLAASHGARRLTVNPLGHREATGLLARVLDQHQVAREPEAAAQLVRTCSALPLALRIAAANFDSSPHGSIASYVAELNEGDRIAALSIQGDSQAVQTVFDVSYHALPPGTRRVFRLMGLVPGPDVDKAAVAALTGTAAEEVSLHIDRLVAAHLIEGNTRGGFTFHDLLRAYMIQRSEAEDSPTERANVIELLFAWYLDHARTAARMLHPHMLRLSDSECAPPRAHFDDHGAAVTWLDRERRNLVAAVDYAAVHGPYSFAWLLADVLRGYFWLRGHIINWLHVSQEARAVALLCKEQRGQAAALVSLAFAKYSQGLYQQSSIDYQTALDLSTEAGWKEGMATALGNLGLAQAGAGNPRHALESLNAAVVIDQSLGRSLGLATTLRTIGSVTAQLGRPVEAVKHLNQALALYESANAVSGQAMTMGSLSNTLRLIGRWDEALAYGRRALDIYRSIGDLDGEAGILEVLAYVHHDTGSPQEAMRLALMALDYAEQNNQIRRLPSVLIALGRISLDSGRTQEAIEYFERAHVASSSGESAYSQAEGSAGLAAALYRVGDYTEARIKANHTLKLAQRAGYRMIEAEMLCILADHQPVSGVTG